MTIEELGSGVVITTKIVPGSSGSTRISGVLDGMLKIKVSAPPERDKANQCLLKFLSRLLEVKTNSLSIIAGKTSPVKRIQITGVSVETFRIKMMQELQGLC